jgi:hypothetical protein
MEVEMIGAFESSANPVYHRNFKEAREAAIMEAASTNGLVLDVTGLSLCPESISFTGIVHRAHFLNNISQNLQEDLSYLRGKPSRIGCFHTTWGKILSTSPPLGLFVFYAPVRVNYVFTSMNDEFLSADKLTVTLELQRTGFSIENTYYGERVCEKCGQVIPEGRLRAIPEVKECLKCTSLIEEGARYERR